MSNNDAESRRAVTAAIASTGSAGVGQMVDAGISSQKKRVQNREMKEAQMARDKAEHDAAKAKNEGTSK